MEGPCLEQSEPVLQGEPLYGPVGTHHQPPWTMNSSLQKEPVKGLSSAQDGGMNPGGHVTILRSNSKELLSGQEKFGGGKSTLLSTHGMYLKENKKKKKAPGGGFFYFGQSC